MPSSPPVLCACEPEPVTPQGIYIAGTFYPMRAQEENADHELYLRSTLASKPGAPLKLYANVIGKFMVERQLGERMQNKVRDRTQQAEKQRLERKTQLLDAPLAIPSTTKSAASKKKKDAISLKRVAPLESRMLSTTSSSQPSRMVSPRPPVSTETPGLKERLIHCAALQDRTTEELIRMLASGTAATLRKEVTELIPQVRVCLRLRTDCLHSVASHPIRSWNRSQLRRTASTPTLNGVSNSSRGNSFVRTTGPVWSRRRD